MKRVHINVTTDTAGAGTGYGESVNGTLYAVQWIDGDLADGVDATLTCETDDISLPVLVEANYNTDHLTYARTPTVSSVDGTTAAGDAMPVLYGRPKLVIANGGSVKTGGCVLYYLDM